MRSLNLKRETLAELTSDELFGVVGASYRTKYECTESHQICNPYSGILACNDPTPLCPNPQLTPGTTLVSKAACTL